MRDRTFHHKRRCGRASMDLQMPDEVFEGIPNGPYAWDQASGQRKGREDVTLACEEAEMPAAATADGGGHDPSDVSEPG
ncbi:hypothetical protein ASF55_17760 [Methylobacterium sp. Leaf119]|nr:hypothetical protein ASF55_17760 [Methylobacterium sp. Leaf119]